MRDRHPRARLTLRDFVNGGRRSDRGSAAHREERPDRAKYSPLWAAVRSRSATPATAQIRKFWAHLGHHRRRLSWPAGRARQCDRPHNRARDVTQVILPEVTFSQTIASQGGGEPVAGKGLTGICGLVGWVKAGPVGFVGRERELSRLRVALGGDTRLVLMVGDAGVGKTRFAGEGMRRAAGAGSRSPGWLPRWLLGTASLSGIIASEPPSLGTLGGLHRQRGPSGAVSAGGRCSDFSARA